MYLVKTACAFVCASVYVYEESVRVCMCRGGGGGGGADVMLGVCVFVHTYQQNAPNYGGRVPVDTTPCPAPMCRALKNQPLNSASRR